MLKLAQVEQMPMVVPSYVRLLKDRHGNLHLMWRWLPGEPEHDIMFGARSEIGFTLDILARRFAETRPWAVEGRAV